MLASPQRCLLLLLVVALSASLQAPTPGWPWSRSSSRSSRTYEIDAGTSHHDYETSSPAASAEGSPRGYQSNEDDHDSYDRRSQEAVMQQAQEETRGYSLGKLVEQETSLRSRYPNTFDTLFRSHSALDEVPWGASEEILKPAFNSLRARESIPNDEEQQKNLQASMNAILREHGKDEKYISRLRSNFNTTYRRQIGQHQNDGAGSSGHRHQSYAEPAAPASPPPAYQYVQPAPASPPPAHQYATAGGNYDPYMHVLQANFNGMSLEHQGNHHYGQPAWYSHHAPQMSPAPVFGDLFGQPAHQQFSGDISQLNQWRQNDPSHRH